ncbi:hypothetical protein AYI69_g10751 [Smittium culicis]|uniref:SAM domain-containing protein n=1 Tax=Smittium culicis TaxID=133412 RepID=A0A1R1X3S6_9FUNG|nr:hypothetical protein AYI69_g10751 [Smittium culicis]
MTSENQIVKQTPQNELSSQPSIQQSYSKDPKSWTVDEVCAWVSSFPYLADLVPIFKSHSLDGHVLINYISNAVLREELGILAFGKRVRFLEALEALKWSIEMSSRCKSHPFLPTTPSSSHITN